MTNAAALFDALSGADRVSTRLDDAAWIRALLAVEVALSHAAAAHGLVPAADADRMEQAAAGLHIDPAALGRAAVEGGNPVIPLVRLLRTAAGAAAAAVHPGATSQDVLDTGLVLLVRSAADVVLDDLGAAADAAAVLAAAHRDTPMIARTLGQQALPTTFGAVAAGWSAGLDRARRRLSAVVGGLPVQFGGAAGTLAASYPHGPAVADALADRLGLARQGVPWHTERTRIGELAGALGVAAGACAKPAADVVALAATELGEVSEAAPGDSSSMPHKRNPIAAITARACARRAPGLAATLLAAMEHEHQRAAGAWHAEWESLTDLLRATGGAAARLRVCLSGLQIHPEAMARNLRPNAAEPGRHHAADLVDRILAARAS
ncbi:3-carboxy-cis,cis-muconate cycloisomerase [Pseudonocardia asaccharolytica]|uniref:3-carboxy-cis,cis-muconate cycloisomerase n=1 Tax=Pseudonocardia asaccharolytica DSM 44247 = NBRC 16224 TaxID=1123024 RepID=A0A511CX63_9PSEU|nr:3-carboxy-cis,cis-muconate cycloisomerase [Pseudonocardia asaccharolytica]GEL17149.1 3-carboxy-cis,cis-muconate cycloisomerase [Pseudonocardia asaccharolytica DSM 44247 = NBRC 16224]